MNTVLPGLKSIFPQNSIGLPDLHSGYGFAIGNMAAFDMDDPKAVVSPGGVGKLFDFCSHFAQFF